MIISMRGRVPSLLSMLLLLLLSPWGMANASLEEGLQLLSDSSFDKKFVAIERLVESGDPKTIKLLQAMSLGQLYYVKSDKRIVLAERLESGYRIRDALSDESLGEVGSRKIRKVSINNNLRSQLTEVLAELQIGSADPEVRRGALESMLSEVDSKMLPLLHKRAAAETDTGLKELLDVAIALARLANPDAAIRLSALSVFDGSLYPAVRNRVRPIADTDPSAEVRKAAAKVLASIDAKVSLFGYLETLFFGISLGSVLILAGIGLAITFGVMGVLNMAHGELIMIGAYTTYVVQLLMPDAIEYSLLVAVPAAFLVSGLVGIGIERGVIRFLNGRPLETLLATFGLSLILQQAVRSIFSPLNRSVETPQWMSGAWEINSIFSLTLNRLYIVVFCLLVVVLLQLILKRTRLGLQVRAVAQNRQMARAMGVRSEWVDAMTFGLGSGVAGIAGVALSQLTNVGPNLGQAYIIDSFMVVVFGGVGNLWGTVVAGLSLGIANKVMEPWAGAVLAKILVLVFIILFIQKRPRGLFPQKGRAAEG
jgi:urea transport system permease protein